MSRDIGLREELQAIGLGFLCVAPVGLGGVDVVGGQDFAGGQYAGEGENVLTLMLTVVLLYAVAVELLLAFDR
jgi:hypothetical protein